MGAFEYTALDTRGRNKRGVLEGDNARQIRQQLRNSGLTPLNVNEIRRQDKDRSRNSVFRSRRGISALDLALITRQLATLLRSGLPIEEALHAVARQCKKSNIEKILHAVRSRVREGHTLATGMADFPQVFPRLYYRTVEAGEQAGHLELVLERLAEYTEARQQLQQKTTLALFYPALLTLMAIIIVAGLLTFVVPQVVHVFDNVSQELPWLTRTLIGISDFLRDYGLYLLAVIILLVMGLKKALTYPANRSRWDSMVIRLPLIGPLVRGSNVARFSRTLSIMLSSSVPILEALHISSQVLTNRPMQQAVEQASVRVREGGNLHQALDDTGHFTPMALSLISSGEASGNLEEMLDRAASIQEREMESVIAMVLGLFEPVLILVMGGIVMIIVLAILLPIFEINQLVA